MEALRSSPTQNEKRNLLSSIFVTILLGIAFQEMISPARESFRTNGPSLALIAYLGVFFLTALRFFIGAQLHLLSDDLLKQGGKAWFFDFSVISIEMIIMAFMGGVASPQTSQAARITFVGFLVALLALDIIWILAQWALGKTWSSWRRSFIPWRWAILNTALVLSLFLLTLATRGPYSLSFNIGLLVLNAIAFAVDVIWTDYFDVI
jgi:hypothetical protein